MRPSASLPHSKHQWHQPRILILARMFLQCRSVCVIQVMHVMQATHINTNDNPPHSSTPPLSL